MFLALKPSKPSYPQIFSILHHSEIATKKLRLTRWDIICHYVNYCERIMFAWATFSLRRKTERRPFLKQVRATQRPPLLALSKIRSHQGNVCWYLIFHTKDESFKPELQQDWSGLFDSFQKHLWMKINTSFKLVIVPTRWHLTN